MSVDARTVKELRDRTGAGFMDCKKALAETGGDVAAAVEHLQKKQLAAVGKKADRVAAEGTVQAYIHAGGRIGVLVEINCETDFVSRNEDFQAFAKDVSMHIAASAPLVLSADDLDQDEIAKQREIFKGQAMEEGKPEHIAAKMVEGRLKKWQKEVCLRDQPFVKDPDKTIADLEAEATAKIGEKIKIRRFARFEVGEGIEKREDDFVAEVARQAGQ